MGFPIHRQRRCHKDRRIGANREPDDQNKCEIRDRAAAKKEKRQRRQQDRQHGQDGPAQGLIDAEINHVCERGLPHQFHIITNTVERDDRVIDRITDNGQDRRDRRKIDLASA